MFVDFSSARRHLERSCEYPVSNERIATVLANVNDVAPEVDRETIEAALARSGATTHHSPDGAYLALIGSVDDSHVGRKYYDDRGGERLVDSSEPVSY